MTLLFYINCGAQIKFESGYFIKNNGDSTICLIKNVDWKSNPSTFEFRLSDTQVIKTASIDSILEFGITKQSKYIRQTVNIDISSNNSSNLSKIRKPEFKQQQVFLKVLIEGSASLYSFEDGNLTRFFYNKINAEIAPLIYKRYITKDKNIRENEEYKQQLLHNFDCPNIKIERLQKLRYINKELLKLFIEYNDCIDGNYEIPTQMAKKYLFNLSIRPRINQSSLTVKNDLLGTRNADFGNKFALGIGVELEFILPYNKNKWGLVLEPSYQTFSGSTMRDISNVPGGILNADVTYNSIEIALGLRHYFYLSDKGKLFLTSSYIFNYDSQSSVEYTRLDDSILDRIEIKSKNNFALDVGYKQNDKFSLALRYQTNREIFGNSFVWSSKYKTLSLIFGYTL